MNYLLILSMLLCCHVLPAQNPTFAPTTDIAKDAKLADFVQRLSTVLQDRNVTSLRSMLDREVMSSFDGENTIAAFFENWAAEDTSASFWKHAYRAVQIGGAFVHDPNDETGRYAVVFPYIYNFEPAIEDDYLAIGCVVGTNVNLRSKPDTKSVVVTKLSHDVIRFKLDDAGYTITQGENETGDPEWYQIETYDGTWSGWIFWKYVYSINGPRMFLYRNDAGEWRISAFVAGD